MCFIKKEARGPRPEARGPTRLICVHFWGSGRVCQAMMTHWELYTEGGPEPIQADILQEVGWHCT